MGSTRRSGAAFLIGPGIGGLAIGFLGAATTFWLSAAMFAVGALIMYAVRIPGAGRPQRHEDASGVDVDRGRGAVRVERPDPADGGSGQHGDRRVWLPIEGVVLPVHFQGLEQPQRLGVTVMALSGGGIVGALIYGAIGHRIGRRLAFVTSMTGSGLRSSGWPLCRRTRSC